MTTFSDYKTLLVEQASGVTTVTLNRPELANAMNLQMVKELSQVMSSIEHHPTRVLVIRGADGNFCAGGDIREMQSIANDKIELANFNRSFGLMIEQADQLPCVVITLLQGAVLGGGFGLACISDVAIADHSARFAMPETSLGIIPAQIAPFVVQRIGLTSARRLALLGVRIQSEEALRLGIIHQIADDQEALEQQLRSAVNLALSCAPIATVTTKKLLHQMSINNDLPSILDQAAVDFANSIQGEGREGAMAFAQKRKPNWQ
ncbi:enoyl-CoA hydratase/isomerase family protein [Endozoicomonas ascidiicola]|uniref:enoyl-CoA hydratase/isomerase family protein n=1 Tax=Endozoicomonas ascidiicola TaxID=1698521 RepID=UPI00083094AE|nr:enoyl-CoA hydratase-related protein [Endozoicomonas ascidiicola]